MNRRLMPVLAASSALLVPTVALADHKPGHAGPGGGGGGGGGGGATTVGALDAKPNPIVFGQSTVLSGRLTGATTGGVTLRLEADETRPYGDQYKPATGPNGAPLTTVSEQNGRFAFNNLRPKRNTQYRAVAQSSPPAVSTPRLVLVRPLVGLIVSDSTPRAGSFVRFRGTVRPAHDGRTVLIQRRSSTGGFVTVARTALRDAGTTFSSYSRRVRIRRDGAYRVKLAGDADHVNGFSTVRTLDVG